MNYWANPQKTPPENALKNRAKLRTIKPISTPSRLSTVNWQSLTFNPLHLVVAVIAKHC
jgi:hypothetical protein